VIEGEEEGKEEEEEVVVVVRSGVAERRRWMAMISLRLTNKNHSEVSIIHHFHL